MTELKTMPPFAMLLAGTSKPFWLSLDTGAEGAIAVLSSEIVTALYNPRGPQPSLILILKGEGENGRKLTLLSPSPALLKFFGVVGEAEPPAAEDWRFS